MKIKSFASLILLLLFLSSSACASEKLNGIKGSNISTILKACYDLGIEEPECNTIDGGFSWHSEFFTINKVQVCYDIVANTDNEIAEARFTMIGGDNGLFYFATFIFEDEKNKERAWNFVQENFGSDANLIIDDAEIRIGTLGTMNTLVICFND